MKNSRAKGVCIYGASNENIDIRFKEDALETGRRVAEAGVPLVSGGGKAGLMRCAIDGADGAGGITIGVLPQFMVERGWQHPCLSEMVVTADMHERKATMASLSRAAIALPGGCGTLEELLEIITWRKLGLFGGRVVILNTLGFYNPLLQQLQACIDRKFMYESHSRLWEVADTPAQAVAMAMDPGAAEVRWEQTIS